MKLWNIETIDGKTAVQVRASSQKDAALKAQSVHGIKPHLIRKAKGHPVIINYTTLQGFTARPCVYTSGDREHALKTAIRFRNNETAFITLTRGNESEHFSDAGVPCS